MNPYKKAKKPEELGQKRIRPWEANGAVSSLSALAAPSTNPAQANVSTAVEEASSNDDSFDCGINWDEALLTLERQSVFDAKPVPRNQHVEAPPRHQSHFQSSSSLPTKKSPESSSLSKMPTAKENNSVSGKHSTPATLIQTLRPQSWIVGNSASQAASTTTTTTARAQLRGTTLSRSNSITSQTCDPDQEGLPSPLRFLAKDVAPVRDEYQKDLVKNANVGAPLLNGWQLYNHQKRAILKALSMRRYILALDMGLGKTLTGCVWAKAFVETMETHVVVICPVSLQEEWKRTMENAVGLVVQDLAGMTKTKTKANKSNGDSENASVSIHSWGKIPNSIAETYGDFVVIADEAHSMQSMTSGRTKDTLKLVSHPLCEGVLLLTGTPMKNGKPSNLFPLLKAVNHPLGRHQKAYETRFCGGREVYFGRGRVWQATGAANLEQLRKLAKSHMLHLTKESCLKDLPPLTRTFVQVPVSSRRQIQHNQALQEMAKIYDTSGRGADDNKILGAVQRVRMVGSLAKVEAAVEQAKQILVEEPAVVIFTSFQEVAKQVHQQLADAGWAGEILTGDTPQKKRQAMVDSFQKGLSPVFCSTFGAGGVGLTLTAAHSIILVDRPWTPGDAHQAEDRVRRIGQTKPVKSIWLRSFDLDEQIDGIIEQKTHTTNAVLTASASESGEQQAAPRLSIFQMLRSVLPATSDGMTQTSILQFSQGRQDGD